MKNRDRFGVVTLGLFCAAGLAQAQTFPQGFEDVEALTASGGWYTQNNSQSPGRAWGQGNGSGANSPFPAHQGNPDDYLVVNFESTTATSATINNWFVTPGLNLANGQQITFFTRSVTANPYPDRIQVRMSTNGFSTNVGSTELDVGDFTNLLLDINPTLLPSPAGYPDVWTQFSITISGLAAPTVGRIAFRYHLPDGGSAGTNSNYVGIDTMTYNGTVATVPTGACCQPNGTCLTLTQPACTVGGGVYGGDNTPCGTCTVFGFVETADVGDVPANAQVLSGSGALTKIVGAIDLDDADMYRLRVCDDPNFSATTHGGPTIDSVMYLFNTAGVGLSKDDDGGLSANHALVTGQFVPGNGEIYLAISTFERDPADINGQRLWLQTNPASAFEPEWAPNGPAAANVVTQWINFQAPTTGSYVITLTGACFIGGTTCYANCDNTGGLTANDFICFLQAYNQGQSYANCDQVGGLTANDFICFLQAYNQGCS